MFAMPNTEERSGKRGLRRKANARAINPLGIRFAPQHDSAAGSSLFAQRENHREV
jgi:hypothetical protein